MRTSSLQRWMKKPGIPPLHRVFALMRLLCYVRAADYFEEYLIMGAESALPYLKAFWKTIVARFRKKYFREPNEHHLERMLSINAARGIQGYIFSMDFHHSEWKKWLLARAGQYEMKYGKPIVVLEAICDNKLWIWYMFFGIPSSPNDINIMDYSPTMQNIRAYSFSLLSLRGPCKETYNALILHTSSWRTRVHRLNFCRTILDFAGRRGSRGAVAYAAERGKTEKKDGQEGWKKKVEEKFYSRGGDTQRTEEFSREWRQLQGYVLRTIISHLVPEHVWRSYEEQ